MRVIVQWRMDAAWEPCEFATCPREHEKVFWAGKRFRVCQVQHHRIEDEWVPHLILQEERT